MTARPAPDCPLPDRPMLTRRELAAALGVSTRSIARWTADRRFPQPYKFGVTRWRRDEVAAWLVENSRACRVQAWPC